MFCQNQSVMTRSEPGNPKCITGSRTNKFGLYATVRHFGWFNQAAIQPIDAILPAAERLLTHPLTCHYDLLKIDHQRFA